ncbi:MAG: tetratricopeptide repeat protein [Qipengyuania sp.]
MALTPDTKTQREDKAARRKAAEEETLLREVDDAVRQGDLEAFGKRYGLPLLALFVLVMAAFGGYLYWQNRQDASAAAESELMVSALDQIEAGNLQTGYDQLERLIAQSDGATRANAQLLQGGIAAEQGDSARAAEIFAGLADDGDAPEELRKVARIREVAVRYDQMKPADVVARLGDLAAPGEAFFGSAGELVAMAYLDQGKRAEAGALFAEIAKDEETPESLRSRARQMASMLGVDAIEDVDALLEEQGVGAEQPGEPAVAAN